MTPLDRRLGGALENDSRVHVHVVGGEVQSNEELEQQGPSRVCDGQESLQTRGRASTYQYSIQITVKAKGRSGRDHDMTYLSVTMSSTAPNFEVWFNALAACPSTASRIHETKYSTVQAFGWMGM